MEWQSGNDKFVCMGKGTLFVPDINSDDMKNM